MRKSPRRLLLSWWSSPALAESVLALVGDGAGRGDRQSEMKEILHKGSSQDLPAPIAGGSSDMLHVVVDLWLWHTAARLLRAALWASDLKGLPMK